MAWNQITHLIALSLSDEEMYFMNIDLAAGCVEVGHVLDNLDESSIEEELFSNETVH